MNHFDKHQLSFVLHHYRPGMFNAQKAWEKVSGLAPRRPVWQVLYWALPVAAAVAIGVFLSWRNTWTEYRACDLAQTFTLKDGTHATLAPGSTLRYQPHKAPRQVEMTGQVHYAVARDESHPFHVAAPSASVTVLGTVFQLMEKEGRVRVDVTEGRVRFGGKGGEGIILVAGQSARLQDGTPVLDTHPLPNPSAWVSGVFRYRATPLQTVVEELSAFYGVPLSVEGNAAGKALTGEFPTDNLDGILDLIELALDVKFTRN
jgi:ferric-dicitrate binding protein FerR (iron transport regulator)